MNKITPSEASKYYTELRDIIGRFDQDPRSVLAIRSVDWQLLGNRLLLFSVASAVLREKKAIQEERGQGGVAPIDELIQDAASVDNWVFPDELYSRAASQDWSHGCCHCGLPLTDENAYYRLKRCKVYLCGKCYDDQEAQQFKDAGTIVEKFLTTHPSANMTML